MLSFVDLPKGIRIVRVENDGETITRTNLGRVSKLSLEMDASLRDLLTPDELKETEEILAGYVEAQLLEARSYAMNLPVILRRVTDYLEQASPVERKFITSGLMEAVRRIRRLERDASA